MPPPDNTNRVFHMAADFINQTNRHIFLTGKAGTGKTTFLKYIREHTRKNTVVIAPTGVAAINAGGVTMHSFFQLPFGPYIPGSKRGFGADNISTDKHTLFRNIRFNNDKKLLLQEMELLIIDEVSMVRCDMLDAMDQILRHYRNRPLLPFGGVQVLYIGDLFQLPPVMPEQEWQLLSQYYESPFFFHAKVIEQQPPLYIELKKIYRQNEQTFIDVLNRVRNNQVEEYDLSLLNDRYDPSFVGRDGEYIVLTTHNRKADDINNARLSAMPGKVWRFEGKIEGDFSDKALPTDLELQLKPGAQVMFLKNDIAEPRRYYNGKIAVVKEIAADEIIVTLSGSEEEVKVEKETWRNIRYTFNRELDSIEEEELGSFTQYPLRLAWAITIHKSQGLTFEKAIIDAGYSFAAGQVYVALSRCTSLEGLVLRSRINYGSIRTDEQVLAFADKENEANELALVLEIERKIFWSNTLQQVFDWQKMMILFRAHMAWLQADKKVPEMTVPLELARTLMAKAGHQQEVAIKFVQQLRSLLDTVVQTGETAQLEQRVTKAVGFFTQAIHDELIQPLKAHIATLKGKDWRKYVVELQGLEADLWGRLTHIWEARYGDLRFNNGLKNYLASKQQQAATTATTAAGPGKKRPEVGSSRKGTLELFLGGKSIAEIATLRQLALSTIESHLVQCISHGELPIESFMPKAKIDKILPHVKELGVAASGALKERLGNDVSYAEIRAVQHYFKQQTDPS
ncbi:helix-turn-helix domain-containing protein [Chitinophaga pendula]|uniref:helix-turn-helix domain-containing protein n=1 Tax=Chitinophaga TaxID=79328 RepID=UPI000BAFA1C1|nr:MULTISPECIES: helix-turn-helix domain-containing protein [Chitinophaga]ASZ12379.1 helicase [Chitinophaga sp. MD30]UCJ10023.1 helix-turn-helix domain-containing protein [Chitinophaga pendula]